MSTIAMAEATLTNLLCALHAAICDELCLRGRILPGTELVNYGERALRFPDFSERKYEQATPAR